MCRLNSEASTERAVNMIFSCCLGINLIAKLTNLIPFSSKDHSASSTSNSNQSLELSVVLNE